MPEPTVADQIEFEQMPERVQQLCERVLRDRIEREIDDARKDDDELSAVEDSLTEAESKIEDALSELEDAERNFSDAKDALDKAIKRLKGNS